MKNLLIIIGIAFLVVISALAVANAKDPVESVESLQLQYDSIQALQERAGESYEREEKIACRIAIRLASNCLNAGEDCLKSKDTWRWFMEEHGYFDEVCIGITYDNFNGDL